jgi:hypothetical protein
MPVLSSLLAGAVDLRNRHMLFAVATALCEQHKGKVIVIAGDDDHRLENNPGCAHEGARGSGGRQRGGDLSAVERGTKGAGNAERETPKLRVPAVTAITINAREALESSIVTCLLTKHADKMDYMNSAGTSLDFCETAFSHSLKTWLTACCLTRH